MFQLYGALGAASLAPQCVLEEAGLPYELVEVDISENSERDPEYLKLNPHGRIPTLASGNQALIESVAIFCIYLADKHPGVGPSPPLDHPDRPHYLQWMVYLTNTLQETLLLKLYSVEYADDSQGQPGVISRVAAKLDMIMAFINRSLGEADGPFSLGSQLSTADIHLNILVGWGPAIYVRGLAVSAQPAEISGQQYSKLESNSVAMLKHPAIARTFAANHY